MWSKPVCTSRKSASAERCLRPLGATIAMATPDRKTARYSNEGLLSHRSLRKDTQEGTVITRFCRSPGIAVEELRAYHAIYSPLFQRREQREWAQKSLHGVLLELPRTSIERMALALEGPQAKAVRTLQLFLSEGAWDDETLLHRHWQEVETSLGEDDCVLTLDGSDFLQQGSEWVGVKRQYCGEVGKRANCQAGVYVGYASRKGYTLLDCRLYLPREWVAEPA